ADDLLELQLAGTSATTFLPFTKAAVPTVDLASGRIVADPPLGVLPDGTDG
ncbi:MAG: ribosome maturation factor RimM, partial [Sulfitobacter sp.]